MFNMCVNLSLMIAVITQRIKNLRQRKMRQCFDYLSRCKPHAPMLDNGAHRRARATNNGFTIENALPTDNVWMGVIKQRIACVAFERADNLLGQSEFGFGHAANILDELLARG